MKNLVIMLGTQDADLTAFSNRIVESYNASSINCGKQTINEIPFKGRCLSSLQDLKSGDFLYMVAHGDGDMWGSESDEVGIPENEIIEELFENVDFDVEIYLCICKSLKAGNDLIKAGFEKVWAADGCPELVWDFEKRKIKSNDKFIKL
jgi:hypothetical protein